MAYDGSIKFDTKIDSSGLEKGLKTAGAAIVTAFGAAAGAAIKVGSDFEAAMSSVSAISRASAEDAEMMKNAALAAGEATQYSATQSANALEYLSLAGYDASESVEALPKVLNLAAAGGMELAYASDLLTDSMAVLGLGIEDMDNFSDQLAMAASKSNTSVAQLGEAVLVAGGQAKLCGMSVEEMNTALGILADKGIKGSEGGTALRNVLKNLYTPTDASAKAMKALGLETADAEGNLRSAQDVLIDLNDILGGLTEEDKTNAMADIFDTRSIAAATALLDDCNDRWDELEGYLSDCDGAAEQMAETMQDNLQGKLKLCASAAEAVGIAVYDGIKEPLKEAAEAGADSLSKLASSLRSGELSQGLSRVGELLGNLASGAIKLATNALPPLISVVGFLANDVETLTTIVAASIAATKGYAILKTIMKWYNSTMVAVNAYTAAIAANKAMETRGITIDLLLASTMKAKEVLLAVLTGKMSLYTAATTLATAAQTAFNTALEANLLGVVLVAIIAVTAAVYLLVKALSKETEEEKKAREEREAFAKKTDELIQKTEELREAQDSLNQSYKDSLDDAAAEAAVAEDLKNKLEELINKEDKTLANKKEIAGIVEELNKILPDLNWNYDEEADKLTDVNGEMVTYIDQLDEYIEAKKRQAEAEAALELYKEEVKERIKLDQQEKDLQEQLATANEEYAQALEDFNNSRGIENIQAAKTLREALDEVEKLEGSLEELSEQHKTATATQSLAWDSYIEAIGGAEEETKSSVDEIKTAFESLDGVPNTVDGVKEALQGVYDKMEESGEYGEDLMTSFKVALENGGDEVFNSIESFIAYVGELMGEAGKYADEGLANGAEENMDLAISEFDALIKKCTETVYSGFKVASPSKVFYEIGNYIVQGLANGISENANTAAGAMRSLVLKLIKTAEETADIRSPSHVFRDEVGAMIAEGVAVGIEKNAKKATEAYKTLSSRLKTQADMDLITQEEYYSELEKARNKYLKKGTAEWLDATESLYSGVKKLEEEAEKDRQTAEKERQEAIENAAKEEKATLDYYYEIGEISEEEYYRKLEDIRDRYFEEDTDSWRSYTKTLIKYEKEKLETIKSEIQEAYEEAFEGVAEKRNAMADKLKEAGVLYSSGTVEIAGEEVKVGGLANIKAQTEYLEKYRDLILGVKERLKGLDVSDDAIKDFFDNLAEMDIEEGTDFANLLMNVSDSQFRDYIGDWLKKQQISEDIADAIYGEETQEAASEFERELADILGRAGVEIPETFFDIGAEAAEKFGEQFCSGISDVLSRAQSMITSFFAASGLPGLSAGEGSSSSYSSTYNFYGSGQTVSEQLRSAQNAAAVERARYA